MTFAIILAALIKSFYAHKYTIYLHFSLLFINDHLVSPIYSVVVMYKAKIKEIESLVSSKQDGRTTKFRSLSCTVLGNKMRHDDDVDGETTQVKISLMKCEKIFLVFRFFCLTEEIFIDLDQLISNSDDYLQLYNNSTWNTRNRSNSTTKHLHGFWFRYLFQTYECSAITCKY